MEQAQRRPNTQAGRRAGRGWWHAKERQHQPAPASTSQHQPAPASTSQLRHQRQRLQGRPGRERDEARRGEARRGREGSVGVARPLSAHARHTPCTRRPAQAAQRMQCTRDTRWTACAALL
ncbi:hypothetical protein ACJQWK_03438 [Exserohilum turcicum]